MGLEGVPGRIRNVRARARELVADVDRVGDAGRAAAGDDPQPRGVHRDARDDEPAAGGVRAAVGGLGVLVAPSLMCVKSGPKSCIESLTWVVPQLRWSA